MDEKNDQDVIEELPVEEDENTDWKALALKNQGIAKRLKTKLEKVEVKPEVKESKPAKAKTDKGELDYAQKAFLISNGIKGTEEHQWALKVSKALGKDLDETIEDTLFMDGLKKMRDTKALEEATPPSSTRSPSSSPRDEVGYWTAKGEMPPADQPKLRQEYVNAKLKSQTDGNPFSSNPIVGAPK